MKLKTLLNKISKRYRLTTFEQLLALLVFLFSLLYILTIFTRLPNGDEGLQAEHAYFLDQNHFVKSDIWEGYGYGWEERQYHYHKGLIVLGYTVINTLGFSLPAFRLIAVVFYLLFVYFLYLFKKTIQHERANLMFLLTLLVLLISNVFAEFIFIFRPEVIVMSLGMGSFYFLQKGIKDGKISSIIVAGILAGLGAFTHLIGIVLIVALGLTLLWFRKIKFTLFFGLFSALALGLYVFDLFSAEAFNGFLFQFTNEASLADKQEHFFSHIFREHQRFFSSEREAMFSLLFFFCLIFNFKFIRNTFPVFMVYGLASILSLMVISHTITPKYALLYFPFMAFVITIGLLRWKKYGKINKVILAILAVVFFGYHSYRDIRLVTQKVNVAERNKQIAAYMPEKGSNVASFSTFVFNEIGNYKIHGLLAFYRYYTKNNPGYKRTTDDFFAFCDSLDDRYIVIDRFVMRDRFYDFTDQGSLKVGDVFNSYKLIVAKDQFFIFENLRLEGKREN